MNFEITDKREYKTTHWYIESENDNYNVICQEGDLEDEWIIRGEYRDEIHIHSYLGVKLIDMCKNDKQNEMDVVGEDKDDE